MRDRSVEYPNRYRMTLVPGTTDIYEMTPVPGEVSEEGTLMSKANILDDNSEIDIWGTIGNRTPNDAFSFIGKSLLAHDKDIANLAAILEGKIVIGTYTGNATARDSYASRTISLGFTPMAVFIFQASDRYPSASGYDAMAVIGQPVQNNYGAWAEIVTDGFKVGYYYNSSTPTFYIPMNVKDAVYNYIAIY